MTPDSLLVAAALDVAAAAAVFAHAVRRGSPHPALWAAAVLLAAVVALPTYLVLVLVGGGRA